MNDIKFENLWRECLETIKTDITSAAFTTWFSKTRIISAKKDNDLYYIEVGCPSLFVKSTLETKYKDKIEKLLSTSLKTKAKTAFNVDKEKLEIKTDQETTPLFKNVYKNEEAIKDAIARSRLRSSYTFENFAVSGSNQMAWAAAEAVSDSPGTAYNPLFIWGGVGVGKTHLMSSVGHRVLISNPNKKVYLCTGEDFTNDIVEGIRNKTTKLFRDKYRKLDLLLIDDIQFIAGKDTVQEEFFHTFNAIVSVGGQVVLTSDRPPHEISKLEERLKSRFEAGLNVDISPPDFELRCAIVEIKAKEVGINITNDIVQFIAANSDSARKIQGLITKIKSEIIFRKITQITEDKILSLLGKKEAENGKLISTTPDEIIFAVCKYFSLGKRDLLGSSRCQKFALPRQILMYILRIDLKLQLEEVGRLINGRDHTTVMHAVEKITRLATESVDTREDISGIKSLLSG